MPIITDAEFGDITIQKHGLAKNISIKLAPNGQLKITMPHYAPLASAKLLLQTSRPRIRKLLRDHQLNNIYAESQTIGKSHHLLIQTTNQTSSVATTGTQIVAAISPNQDITAPPIQQAIRQQVILALRKEAKSYLPRRLAFLAEQHGFRYKTTRFTHASSRWGSCSTNGTISLNIALMKLPFELIDYVLIHELCHTRQMNHSPAFWREVAAIDKNFQTHRRALKTHHPHL